MSGKTFVDTNILLYARDASEPKKQAVAEARLRDLWETRTGRVSIQVLNEFYVNATRKLDPGLSVDEAWDDIESLMAWKPLSIDFDLMQRGFRIQNRYGLSWWDSLIVAAAVKLGCERILSEDLSPTQRYQEVEVENPFASS